MLASRSAIITPHTYRLIVGHCIEQEGNLVGQHLLTAHNRRYLLAHHIHRCLLAILPTVIPIGSAAKTNVVGDNLYIHLGCATDKRKRHKE